MPTPSLLLQPLKPLPRLIPSVLALLPILLRPPQMAARLPPLALRPFVPRLPIFALRPVAFLPTPSNHARLTRRRAPGLSGLTCIQSLCPTAPQSPPNNIPPHPTRHSGVFSRNPVLAPRLQTPPKCTPRRLKSFLEKTLIAREAPNFDRLQLTAHPTAARLIQSPSESFADPCPTASPPSPSPTPATVIPAAAPTPASPAPASPTSASTTVMTKVPSGPKAPTPRRPEPPCSRPSTPVSRSTTSPTRRHLGPGRTRTLPQSH